MIKNDVFVFITETIKYIKQTEDVSFIVGETLVADLCFDEIDMTHLIIECEEKFNILIDDSHIMSLKMVNDVVNYVYMEALTANQESLHDIS